MRIAVGSTNPVKVAAVRDVVQALYGSGVEVLAVAVDPGVRAQPIGVEEILQGAINRAIRAREATDADMGVGIEAGLVPIQRFTLTGYVDVQWCAVVDCDGRITVGHGPGFEYPPSVIVRVFREDLEVGRVVEELSGIRDIGKRVGAIGWLSKGATNRREFTRWSVLMAFIPRIREELYLR